MRLATGNEKAELLIQPRVFIPIAELHVPERHTLGAAALVGWRSDAQSCTLRVVDGSDETEHTLGPVGSIDIVPQHAGELRVELIARGRHARVSPELGIAKLARSIQVVAPGVVVTLDALEKSIPVGDEGRFSWSVEGARAVRIEALDRGESYSVQRSGTLVVEAGGQPERFRLVATGLDGAESSASFRLIPRLLSVSRIPVALDGLNLSWE